MEKEDFQKEKSDQNKEMYQQNSDEEVLESAPGGTQLRWMNSLTPPLGDSLIPSPGALGRDAVDTLDEKLTMEEHCD